MADVLADSMRTANESSAVPGVSRRSWFSWRSPQPETWSLLTAYPGENCPSIWKTRIKEPGLVEIEHPLFSGSRRTRSRVLKGLRASWIEPGSCRLNRRTSRLVIRLAPERLDLAQLLDAAEQAIAGNPGDHTDQAQDLLPALNSEPSVLVTGPKRLLYLALGGGSFALIFAGITVPGIPMVTFAVLSGYYLVRSSVRLHEGLLQSRFFRDIIEEWSTFQGLSRRSKIKLMGMIATAVAVSFSVVPPTEASLAMTFVLTTGGLYSLLSLPGIDEDQTAGSLASLPGV